MTCCRERMWSDMALAIADAQSTATARPSRIGRQRSNRGRAQERVRQVALAGLRTRASDDRRYRAEALLWMAGRVGMWRGGGRLGMSVSAPFVWRCLSGSAI